MQYGIVSWLWLVSLSSSSSLSSPLSSEVALLTTSPMELVTGLGSFHNCCNVPQNVSGSGRAEINGTENDVVVDDVCGGMEGVFLEMSLLVRLFSTNEDEDEEDGGTKQSPQSIIHASKKENNIKHHDDVLDEEDEHGNNIILFFTLLTMAFCVEEKISAR
mmetsp:Transcript_1843/g.2285  ORF Transcript_1843/g.2285 Transcript_1843/m.2285 type:complete len:161 (-) Transcript_1843:48-530(-)